MIMRNVYFTREFVDGTLKGLTYDYEMSYPEEVFERYFKKFEKDVETGRVIDPVIGGSKYKIISCRAGSPYERTI